MSAAESSEAATGVASRRAASAAAGAAVAAGTMMAFHAAIGLRYWDQSPVFTLLCAAAFTAATAASALTGFVLARRRPRTSSLVFSCAVTAAGVAVGGGGITGFVLAVSPPVPPLEALAMFGLVVFLGLPPLALGMLTVFLADRRATRPSV